MTDSENFLARKAELDRRIARQSAINKIAAKMDCSDYESEQLLNGQKMINDLIVKLMRQEPNLCIR